jgi:hypothetical protein
MIWSWLPEISRTFSGLKISLFIIQLTDNKAPRSQSMTKYEHYPHKRGVVQPPIKQALTDRCI